MDINLKISRSCPLVQFKEYKMKKRHQIEMIYPLTTPSLSGGGCPGFLLWYSQSLERVTPPWLANPRPPAMSPHANGTRHLSHWSISGKIKEGGRDGRKRMIQRLNEESGRQENVVLSTWRRCKQGWPLLSQTTDRWPRPRASLLTVLNKFNFIKKINKLTWSPKAL